MSNFRQPNPRKVAEVHTARTAQEDFLRALRALPYGTLASFQTGSLFSARMTHVIKSPRGWLKGLGVQERNRQFYGRASSEVVDLDGLLGTGEASNFGVNAEAPEIGGRVLHPVTLAGLPEGSVLRHVAYKAADGISPMEWFKKSGDWLGNGVDGFVVKEDDTALFSAMMHIHPGLTIQSY